MIWVKTIVLPENDLQDYFRWLHASVPCVLFSSERGARPVTNFMRNLSALSNWHSVYTSAIAFIVSPHYASIPTNENRLFMIA